MDSLHSSQSGTLFPPLPFAVLPCFWHYYNCLFLPVQLVLGYCLLSNDLFYYHLVTPHDSLYSPRIRCPYRYLGLGWLQYKAWRGFSHSLNLEDIMSTSETSILPIKTGASCSIKTLHDEDAIAAMKEELSEVKALFERQFGEYVTYNLSSPWCNPFCLAYLVSAPFPLTYWFLPECRFRWKIKGCLGYA